MQYVLRVGLSESLQGIAAINRSTEVQNLEINATLTWHLDRKMT